MPNYRDALKEIAPKTFLNRVRSFGERLTRRRPTVNLDNQNPVPAVQLNSLGYRTNRSRIAKNTGSRERKANIYQENFEQTFIKECIASLSTRGTSFLDEYKRRLTDPSCSKIEAIYLYDHLICMMLISIVALIIISIDPLELILIARRSGLPPFYIERISDLQNASLYKNWELYLIAFYDFMQLPVLATGIALSGPTVMVSLIGSAMMNLILFSLRQIIATQDGNTGIERRTSVMNKKLHAILLLMFNIENTFRIETLKAKLKFWSLPQPAVDHIFATWRPRGLPVADVPRNNSTQSTCPICLETYNESPHMNTTTLTCEHKVHTSCLQGWYAQKDSHGEPHTCPFCRADQEPVQTEDIRAFIRDILMIMDDPAKRTILSNVPFTKELMDYKYTMYDQNKFYGTNGSSFFVTPAGDRRARVRERGRAAINTQNALQYAPLPGNPFEGGRRIKKQYRTRRRQRM